jgi:hypothetical protein
VEVRDLKNKNLAVEAVKVFKKPSKRYFLTY